MTEWPTAGEKAVFERLPSMVGEAWVDVPGLKLWIIRRPYYCDRGTWMLHADPQGMPIERVHVDRQDGFPRYYFDLDAMLTEIRLFLQKRGLWDTENPPAWKFEGANG